MKTCITVLVGGMLVASGAQSGSCQEQTVRVSLSYSAPGTGPAPNFSPKGTQVPLTLVDGDAAEPYLVNFWSVREDTPGAPPEPPSILRYSVGSWRAGTVTINGTEALVAAMDA